MDTRLRDRHHRLPTPPDTLAGSVPGRMQSPQHDLPNSFAHRPRSSTDLAEGRILHRSAHHSRHRGHCKAQVRQRVEWRCRSPHRCPRCRPQHLRSCRHPRQRCKVHRGRGRPHRCCDHSRHPGRCKSPRAGRMEARRRQRRPAQWGSLRRKASSGGLHKVERTHRTPCRRSEHPRCSDPPVHRGWSYRCLAQRPGVPHPGQRTHLLRLRQSGRCPFWPCRWLRPRQRPLRSHLVGRRRRPTSSKRGQAPALQEIVASGFPPLHPVVRVTSPCRTRSSGCASQDGPSRPAETNLNPAVRRGAPSRRPGPRSGCR
jgi:hypothetical protein